MNIIKIISTALRKHTDRDDAFGPKECCKIDCGYCPLDDYLPDDIERMKIPDLGGPRSRPAYCLGLAGALLRERSDGREGRNGFLHILGAADGRHRSCICNAMRGKGVELDLYRVKPDDRGLSYPG